ncbi:MAG: rRNA pseudouridine synthase [Oscillospiraceae bacterium]|jgi:16S rRNA pseudouridine516 synthase|nr:rRNA pseudouridine synthase [Oscillospiraceae bacterium]
MPVRRLDQLLAARGCGSRKDAAALIKAGAVRVNGNAAHGGDQKIDTEKDSVTLRGEPVALEDYVYYLLHKPLGVISASRDPKAATVLDLLPEPWRRRGLFPAGRLDKESTGLLLLTNDGALAHALLSPRRHVAKTYVATLAAAATPADAAAFAAGMHLPPADGHPPEDCQPAKLIPLPGNRAEVTLREGKYHQIRRMFAQRGNEVLALHRTAMGSLRLEDELQPGQCRPLTAAEVAGLKGVQAAGGMF